MKLAMTLRTRLFLSISALITVALLGLILGLVSVMQMAKTQESLIRSNFTTLDLGLKLRQSLGDQLMMMLEQRPDPEALNVAKQHYFDLLDQGVAHEQRNGQGTGFSQARGEYQNLLEAFDQSQQPSPPPGSRKTHRNLQRTAQQPDRRTQAGAGKHQQQRTQVPERALLIAGLLGLVGLAVLIIGLSPPMASPGGLADRSKRWPRPRTRSGRATSK
jgi:NtrC-family two-component system sensor histidine kinase KinB